MIMIPSSLKICFVATSLITLMVGEASTSTANDAYVHAKDLTVSGLLLGAVIFLYRELERVRKEEKASQIETKAFVVAQTESIQRATDAQRVALEHVGSTLTALTTAASEQTEMYRRHIDSLIITTKTTR